MYNVCVSAFNHAALSFRLCSTLIIVVAIPSDGQVNVFAKACWVVCSMSIQCISEVSGI